MAGEITADYYVDMDETFESTYSANGTAFGTPWGGPTGLMRAIAVMTAGQSVAVAAAAVEANTEPLTKLWKVPCTNTTNFAVADLATMDAAGENCTGRIAVIVTDDYMLCEEVTGTFANLVATDTITTAPGLAGTPGDTTLDGSPAMPGIDINADYAT